MSKTRSRANRKKRRKGGLDKPMLFTAFNYRIMVTGILMVMSGFAAMYIENLEKGIFSLYISPIIIVAGFAVVAYAILKTDKTQPGTGITETSASGE